MDTHASSFTSLRAYLSALSHTPSRFARRAVSVSTSYEEMSRVRARSGSNMRKTLRWFDLVGFGIGGMVGAGVFVTTGRASHLYAGPAVVLSYAIAGLCALLSAFCYTEFAVDMPVAGGAFSYLRVTFGEFAAFLTGANLVMDYVMSNAAVARGFTAYFGTAIGISSAKWRLTVPSLPNGFNQIDIVAVAVVLLITLVICYSTRESSVVNMILTALHIVFIAFVIVVGFWRGSWKNFTEPGHPGNASGFFPYGVSGVFNGAAIVYMSYIGYDAVSTMAEEVREPVKDIPVGVSGSVIIVSILYCLMAASMSKLLPYDMIDEEAPFSAAFSGKSDGWGWVSRVIGVGASFGILTSLLVAMLGQARYMCVIGRSSVVPAWFAKVHPRTSTPVNASAFLGIFTAALALFTDLDVLLNLVSIGTLFVFYMVANAVIYRRYVAIGTTNPWPTLSFLCSFSFTSIMFTLIWKFVPTGRAKAGMLSACGVIAVAILQIFHCMVPQARKPEFWGVPLMPWIPSISIFLNVFLLGSLDGPSYVRFGFFSAVAVLVYVFSHMSLSLQNPFHFQPSLSFPSNSMGSTSTQQEEQPNSYFDLIPDDILHLILNRVLDAKTLVRCLSLSKRFASIIPQTNAVSLPLFLPSRHRHHAPIRLSGNPVNILKSVVNYLITKPLHHLRRNRRRDSLSDSPCHCPPHLLRTFRHITHLYFELHTYGGSIDTDFLKWKATYGSHLKSCVVLCATSFHRNGSAVSRRNKPEEDETTPSTVPNEVFKSRIVWTISCLIAASARHFLLKQMLLQFPMLRTIAITDAKKQGRFSMEEGEIRDLRDSLKRGGAAVLSPNATVVPDLRMRMWYVPELELPALGCVMKGATLLVIGPAGDDKMVPAAEERGSDGGFDGDEAEKALFGVAEREIVKKKRKSSYVMEMTSF